MKNYFLNFRLLNDHNFKIVSSIVVYPGLLPYIDKIEKLFHDSDIAIDYKSFVGIYKGQQYPEAYTENELERFNLRDKIATHQVKDKICNAGYNIAKVEADGSIYPCSAYNSDLGNIYNDIRLNSHLLKCNRTICPCPYWHINTSLYQLALTNTSTISPLDI